MSWTVAQRGSRDRSDTVSEAPSRIAYEWDVIEDLPDDWESLCRVDLQAVHRQWIADISLIKDEDKLHRFQEQLALQWAVETGIIERLYKIDRGVTLQILQAGMEALGQFHARGLLTANAQALNKDQREALEMLWTSSAADES